MQHVNGNAADFQNFGFGELASPGSFVDVSADCGYGCDFGQFFKDFRRTDVAGVNDVLRTSQRSKGFGTQKAVRIGDYADGEGSAQFSVSVLINLFISECVGASANNA